MAGLTYRGTELRDLPDIFFWISGGWRDGREVRGKDAVIIGAAGQYELNRVADYRTVQLTGLVLTDTEEEWDVQMALLEALFDPLLGSDDLVVSAPYMGLPTATSRTIAVRVVNYLTVDITAQQKTRWDVTLRAVGNPPDWTDEELS
jgi:hypothetical protein